MPITFSSFECSDFQLVFQRGQFVECQLPFPLLSVQTKYGDWRGIEHDVPITFSSFECSDLRVVFTQLAFASLCQLPFPLLSVQTKYDYNISLFHLPTCQLPFPLLSVQTGTDTVSVGFGNSANYLFLF